MRGMNITFNNYFLSHSLQKTCIQTCVSLIKKQRLFLSLGYIRRSRNSVSLNDLAICWLSSVCASNSNSTIKLIYREVLVPPRYWLRVFASLCKTTIVLTVSVRSTLFRRAILALLKSLCIMWLYAIVQFSNIMDTSK